MRDNEPMWLHYCHSDHGWYSIGSDEACTWCGQVEANEPPHFVRVPPLQNMDASGRGWRVGVMGSPKGN
jgi:hypothetical protein